jgi:hypothetical protein
MKDAFPNASIAGKFFRDAHGIALELFREKCPQRGARRRIQEARVKVLNDPGHIGFFFDGPLAAAQCRAGFGARAAQLGGCSRRMGRLLFAIPFE